MPQVPRSHRVEPAERAEAQARVSDGDPEGGAAMREQYTYEIATSFGNGDWKVIARRTHAFQRKPESIARCLIESWIYEQRGDLPGGTRVMVFGDLTVAEPAAAYVRVRVHRGFPFRHESRSVAVAYLSDPTERKPRGGRRHRRRLLWGSRRLAGGADTYGEGEAV
jgi:hypothetical protein